MTTDERLERIENGWLQIQQALKTVIDSQVRTNDSIADLAKSVGSYVEAADARMKRIEENLDGLIRAITREHTNGKTER